MTVLQPAIVDCIFHLFYCASGSGVSVRGLSEQ